MPDIAAESAALARALDAGPAEGLTQPELAALLKWPLSLVNERLSGMGSRVRHAKVQVGVKRFVKYTLNTRR